MQHLGLRLLLRHSAGDNKVIVLHDHFKVLGVEARHCHGKAISVFASPLNVVGWIARHLSSRCCHVRQLGQTIEADGSTEQWSKIESCHVKPPVIARPLIETARNEPASSAISGTHPGIPKDLDMANTSTQIKNPRSKLRGIGWWKQFRIGLTAGLHVVFCTSVPGSERTFLSSLHRHACPPYSRNSHPTKTPRPTIAS